MIRRPGRPWANGSRAGASPRCAGRSAIMAASVRLKIDWFATRDVLAADPIVIHDLREGIPVALSDHDAVGLDVLVPVSRNGLKNLQ